MNDRSSPSDWLLGAAVVRVGGPQNARPLGSAAPSTSARSAADVARDVAAARAGGARTVVLAGEPLVRPDLGPLLASVRKAGLACGVVSSGRALAYPAVRARLVQAGARYVRLGLHAADAAHHDALVGVEDAFEQTLGGLAALAAEAPRGMLVEVACTVVAGNEARLDALAERVAAVAHQASLGLRFVAPDAGLEGDEWPSREAPRAVASAIDRALALAPDLVVSWEGFPPCLLAAHAERRDELLRWGAPAFGPADATGALVAEVPGARARPYPCQDCVNEPTCPAIAPALLERWGEKALAPTRAVRANSFNYELAEELGPIAPASSACPIRSLPQATDAVRDLVLIRDGSASLYRSPTSDFTDAEVRRTKLELEQIYADVSETAVLTEFTAGVRRVRPHVTCAPCAERSACPGAWTLDAELPFFREERWLRKEVSRARGRVLDVGCGEQPYRDEIAQGIAEGRIDYRGLDPDAGAIERFRAAVPGGRLEVGGIEEYDGPAGWFDYVLVFRSFNHLRDLERAFDVIERALRPDGMLYVVDSVVFGMLRTKAQVEFADVNAPVGHEHFRNWSSHQVLAFLERYRFRVNVHRPVTREGSNQWMLKLLRTADPASTVGRPS